MAKVQISLNEAKALSSSRRVIPLVETLFSGSETPLSVFEKLAANLSGSFLLESAQQGVWARYSFVGVSMFNFIIIYLRFYCLPLLCVSINQIQYPKYITTITTGKTIIIPILSI
jgi:hypothetical protein